MKKYIPFIKLLVASVVLVVVVNFVTLYAARPASGYPNGQPSLWNVGSTINSKVGSLMIGSTANPASGTKLDIYGTLATNGIVSDGNASVVGNLLTKELKISSIISTSTPKRLCVSNTGGISLCQENTTTGEQIYSNPGTFQWTVPSGVNQISVEVVGAGGAGYIAGFNLSDLNMVSSNPSSITGPDITISAPGGGNGTATSGGAAGSPGTKTGTRITSGQPIAYAGTPGGGVLPVPTPSITLCPPPEYGSRQAIIHSNHGGDGATGGGSYISTSVNTQGRRNPSINSAYTYYRSATGGGYNQYTTTMNCSSNPGWFNDWMDIHAFQNLYTFSGVNEYYTNTNNIFNSMSLNGSKPGGGGSTPGGWSGEFGISAIDNSSASYTRAENCSYYDDDVCLGNSASSFRYRPVALPGPHSSFSYLINKAYGGGGGGYIKTTIPVTPGEIFNISVGRGGQFNLPYGSGGSNGNRPVAGNGAPGQVKITW